MQINDDPDRGVNISVVNIRGVVRTQFLDKMYSVILVKDMGITPENVIKIEVLLILVIKLIFKVLV